MKKDHRTVIMSWCHVMDAFVLLACVPWCTHPSATIFNHPCPSLPPDVKFLMGKSLRGELTPDDVPQPELTNRSAAGGLSIGPLARLLGRRASATPPAVARGA
jgi:hypothetical protein